MDFSSFYQRISSGLGSCDTHVRAHDGSIYQLGVPRVFKAGILVFDFVIDISALLLFLNSFCFLDSYLQDSYINITFSSQMISSSSSKNYPHLHYFAFASTISASLYDDAFFSYLFPRSRNLSTFVSTS